MIGPFFDAHIRPPRGGWNYTYQGELIQGYSESDIVEKITRIQRNNATFTTSQAIRDEIWKYFCSREPTRCGMATPPAPLPDAPAGVSLVSREITPVVQGPPIWTFLNTLACVWRPGLHDYFLATCDAVSAILECPDCRNEWRRQLNEHPPVSLDTRLKVCQWVNSRHNAVNARAGKLHYPYWRMVTEFGAPLP